MTPINPTIGPQNQIPVQMQTPNLNLNNLTPQELMAMQQLAQRSQYQSQRQSGGLLFPVGGVVLTSLLGAFGFAPKKYKDVSALLNLSTDEFKQVSKEKPEFAKIKEYFDNIVTKNKEFCEKYFTNSEVQISVDDLKNKAKLNNLDDKTIERVVSTAMDGKISKIAAEETHKKYLIETLSGDLKEQFDKISKFLPKKRFMGALIGVGIAIGISISMMLAGILLRKNPNQ